jgi:hypothetical protein
LQIIFKLQPDPMVSNVFFLSSSMVVHGDGSDWRQWPHRSGLGVVARLAWSLGAAGFALVCSKSIVVRMKKEWMSCGSWVFGLLALLGCVGVSPLGFG